jgi:hypothetical protein
VVRYHLKPAVELVSQAALEVATVYKVRYGSFLWQRIPAFTDGDTVLTTHRFAARVNDPNLCLHILRKSNRLTVGDVNYPARAAHAHAREHDQEDRA